LAEIARPGSTRETLAAVYRQGIAAQYNRDGAAEFVDWPTVNHALLKRYTKSGLIYIKRLAWKGYRIEWASSPEGDA